MDAATRWKLVPFAILVPTVIFAVWRIQVALDDPHFSVPDDYYEKGVHFDEELARRAASDALAWSGDLEPGTRAEGGGVRLTLTDAAGAPVAGATGSLRAFHNAYPAQAQEVSWREAEPGVYDADLVFDRSGNWRWQVVLTRDDQRWQSDLRQEVYDR